MERKLIDLGWAVAILEDNEIGFENKRPDLTIVSPDDETHDNQYIPASSVRVYGIKKIEELHKGLGEFIEEYKKGL